MTSITKSDSELTTNPDSIDSNLTEEPRVSTDDTSNGDKPRVSQIELNSIPSPPTDVDSTIVFDGTVKDVDVEVRVSESNDESDGDDKNEDLGFVVSSSDGGKEVYSSLLSDFEDFVANEKREASAATSRARSFGFEIGDMVWGKVKSHPWWPGHIFNEAFASSSVRRTRREGHVLVAFFGDSSYGWFDPAELIPFDPNFAEKSQQTNSRNFVKAVEEAVDEASRRCGLGLVCKCRNKYNFRPTKVQGYLAVDVPDYEVGGVYSDSQIMKARDDFSPAKVLGFMKDLAQVVQFSDTSSIDFIKNKATFFALRKATFEEFDETYAEAFETQPTRPSSNAVKASGQPPKAPTRAPLSGPLVIAEALGDRKSLKKSPKVKDNVKKEKYLFKRRDEPSDSKAFQIGQKQDDSFVPASYMEGSPLVAAGDYGLQKRMPAPKHELTELISSETAGPRESEPKQLSSEQPSGKFGASATYVVGGQGILQSVDNQMVLDGGGPRTGGSDLSGKEDNLISVDNVPQFSQHEGEGNAAHGLDESTKSLKSNESSHPNEMIVSVGVDGEKLGNIGDGTPGSHLSASVLKNSSVTGTADGAIKKTEVLKRPIGDLNSEKSEMGEKKKKKKKVSVASPDLPVKRSATGKAIMKKSAGKLKQRSLGSAQLDLPELLHDLHDLALDASNSGGQNHRSLARRFFLRFRSLVYQKSVVASPSSGTESVEIRTSKSSSSVGALDNSESVVPSKTVVRPLGRSDDPTKGGEKRLPSDRQEEIAAKRLKKINQLKSIAADKKASHKPLDTQGDVKEPVAGPTLKLTQREAKEPVAASTPNLVKPPSAKKKAPVKAVEPTMLVMKFPPQTSLPSGAELKAKFARFGSIDQSAIRVFWKSSTCRVVFRYKSDAQAAYRYAMGNRSLFGNLEVRYMLREVGAAAEAPESDNARGGDSYVEVPRVKDPLLERPTPPLAPIPLPPSSMQPPKSILKKPNGDEAAVQGTGNNGRGTSRVKFMLGGEETSTTSKPIEQMMTGYRTNINNNNNNSTATSVGVCGAATSVASEYNSKNFQNFVPPPSSLPPLLPSPPQFAKPPHPFNNTNLQNPNVPPTTSTVTSASASARQNVDISHEMLSLLTKCNDVVTGVRGLLGYVPYHPL